MGTVLTIGNDRLKKGELANGRLFYAWDAVHECSGDRCSIFDKCGYIKTGKCAVQVKYLETFFSSVLNTYTHLDDTVLYKMGMHLVPLYSQLCRLKIEEMSVTEIININEKGTRMINPIFKEIRETLKVIHLMWRDLDFCPPMPKDPSATPEDDKKPKDIYGDPGHVEKLEKERGGLARGTIR